MKIFVKIILIKITVLVSSTGHMVTAGIFNFFLPQPTPCSLCLCKHLS